MQSFASLPICSAGFHTVSARVKKRKMKCILITDKGFLQPGVNFAAFLHKEMHRLMVYEEIYSMHQCFRSWAWSRADSGTC